MPQATRSSILTLCLASLLITPVLAISTVGHAGTCSPHEIGPDTSLGIGGSVVGGFGDAIGETFMATDTLIESITVWRLPGDDTSLVGYELFIVGTDSLGRPDIANTLLQGKVGYNTSVGGMHGVPITFSFDPSFALPTPGKYEFAVQLVPCSDLSYLLVAVSDVYPDGAFWRHGRTYCDHLRDGGIEAPNGDLIFTIVFCQQSVPTQMETWGSIKARYR